MKILIQVVFAVLAAFGLTAILVAWLLWRKDIRLEKIHREYVNRNKSDEDEPLGI